MGFIRNMFSAKDTNNITTVEPSTQMQKRVTTFSRVTASFSGWGSWNASNGLTDSSYVFMCVNEIVKNLASVEWQIETRDANGIWSVDLKHPTNSLISKPNAKGSFSKLVKEMYVNYDLDGNFILHKIRGVGGNIIGLECLPAQNVKPKKDTATNTIIYYEYKVGNRTERIYPDDIIHGLFYNPSDSTWGISKLDVLKRALDCDSKATEWNKSSMENRGVTDGAFVIDEILDSDELREAMVNVKENYANVNKGREPWVLHGGVKWVNMSRTPVEMDYLDTRKYTREEIAGVFGVPLLLLGVLERSSYNNLDTSKKLLWQDTIIPLLDELFETLNFSLQQEFGENWRITYNLSNVSVLQEDRTRKIDDATKLKALGLSIETINKMVDLGLTEEDLKDLSI